MKLFKYLITLYGNASIMKKLLPVLLIFLLITGCGDEQIRSFEQLEYPFEVHYQDLPNGATLAYADEGEGDRVLVMIHGLGSYLPTWKNNVEALSEEFRVIAPDLPGYGKSSKQAAQHTIPFFTESILQLLDELNIESAVFAGHSMGGQIALYMAAVHPNRTEALILTAPAGFERFTDQERELFRSMISPEMIAATPDSIIRQNVNANFYQTPEEAEFMIDDRMMMRNAPDFGYYARAQAESIFAMLEETVWDRLPSIKQPTLVVFGRQDALIPNRQLHPELSVEEIARAGTDRMPNASLIMIDEAGHFVHFEQAGMFNQVVIEFLEE